MDVSRFDFDLPSDLIAQEPSAVRDQSRLMVVNRRERSFSHHVFSEIGDFLPPGATLIRNNASVLPARLRGALPGGGAVECLLLTPTSAPNEWWCLVRPGRRLREGARLGRDGEWRAEVLQIADDGRRLVRFEPERAESFLSLVNRIGEMPLPPYIQRETNDRRAAVDRERYQTVFANPQKQVAAAAPTAGLHFTLDLEKKLKDSGFSFADLTLHIGLGTFQPIKTNQIEDHQIHCEIYEIPPPVRRLIGARDAPPRVAVGTTVTRAIEDYSRKASVGSSPQATFLEDASIYIYPPFDFHGIDSLVTNFHLPRSSLLCLVSAFLSPGEMDGIDWLLDLYDEAIRERYRFFSYGDAMLIV